jgi:hypothetical protein
MSAGLIRRLWRKLVEAWRTPRRERPAEQRLESDHRRQLRRERERPFPMF